MAHPSDGTIAANVRGRFALTYSTRDTRVEPCSGRKFQASAMKLRSEGQTEFPIPLRLSEKRRYSKLPLGTLFANRPGVITHAAAPLQTLRAIVSGANQTLSHALLFEKQTIRTIRNSQSGISENPFSRSARCASVWITLCIPPACSLLNALLVRRVELITPPLVVARRKMYGSTPA